MPNITSAGVFWEEGKEPPDYVDPRLADAGPEPEPAPAEPPSMGVVIPMPAEEPAAEPAAAEAVAEPGTAAEAETGAAKAPPVRASRADWAAHAVEVHGADPDAVDEMTKQQLIGAYGSAPGE